MGVGYLPKATITATEVYERLRQWYIDNGTLEVKDLGDGKTRDIWNTQTTWGDHTVRGLNQILSRLLKIFPKATRARDSLGRNCLEGIGFFPPGNGGEDHSGGKSPNSPQENSVSQYYSSEAGLNVSEAELKQLNSSHSNSSEASEAKLTVSRMKNLWTVLSEEERSQLLQELGLEINSPVNSSTQLQLVQNTDGVSITVSSELVQPASELVQNPLSTVQQLANQILLCQTWTAIAAAVNHDGEKLKQAAVRMTPEERSCLTQMLAAHLCNEPSALNQLAWVPVKLRDKALKQLTFTIRRIAGIGVHDASLEYVSGYKFVSLEHLGTRNERWIFEAEDGSKLAVFGVDAVVEAIA